MADQPSRDVIGPRVWQSLGLLLLVGAYWYLEGVHRTLVQQRAMVAANRPKASLLAGYAVRLDAYTSFVRGSARATMPLKRQLVVISSDTCAACAAEVASWQRLFKRLPLGGSDEVVLVTLNTSKHLDSLPELLPPGVAWRIVRVTDIGPFVAATGFVATPMVAILDGASRLRAVARNVTPEIEAILAGVYTE